MKTFGSLLPLRFARYLSLVGVVAFAAARLGAATLADQIQTTIQPSLALTYFVDPNSGFVDSFAGNFVPGGDLAANGQLVAIASYPDLFSIMGTQFGGDGVTTFAMPNLNGKVAVGAGVGSGLAPVDVGQEIGAPSVSLTSANYPPSIGGQQQAFSNEQASLGLHYVIETQGVFPSRNGNGVASNTLGLVSLYAGAVAPRGWAFADGSLLSISQNTALFSLLGTLYGGNGISNFALPDLRGRTAIGTGAGVGLSPRAVGDTTGAASTTLTNANLPIDFGGTLTPYDNLQPSLALEYFIAPLGIFPPRDAPAAIDLSTIPIVGQVVMFASNFTPDGWFPANGELVPIGSNTALFSLLGTQFGGNGLSNFALPDLRGRDIIGSDGQYSVGDEVGVESLTLADISVPSNPNGGDASPVPEPATLTYVIVFVAALFGKRIFAPRRKWFRSRGNEV